MLALDTTRTTQPTRSRRRLAIATLASAGMLVGATGCHGYHGSGAAAGAIAGAVIGGLIGASVSHGHGHYHYKHRGHYRGPKCGY